MDENNNIWRL